MKNQSQFLERNKALKGRVTLVTFDVDSKERRLTHTGLSLVSIFSEIASSSRFNGLIYKMFIDLPYELDAPKELTNEWLLEVEKYDLNLYI